MTDKIKLEAGSPQEVAFRLMEKIMSATDGSGMAAKPVKTFGSKDQILDLYAECLHATHNDRVWRK